MIGDKNVVKSILKVSPNDYTDFFIIYSVKLLKKNSI